MLKITRVFVFGILFAFALLFFSVNQTFAEQCCPSEVFCEEQGYCDECSGTGATCTDDDDCPGAETCDRIPCITDTDWRDCTWTNQWGCMGACESGWLQTGSCGGICGTPTPTATPTSAPPPPGGNCDTGCGQGACGYLTDGGTCTTSNTCCYRKCNSSNQCVEVAGTGQNNECDPPSCPGGPTPTPTPPPITTSIRGRVHTQTGQFIQSKVFSCGAGYFEYNDIRINWNGPNGSGNVPLNTYNGAAACNPDPFYQEDNIAIGTYTMSLENLGPLWQVTDIGSATTECEMSSISETASCTLKDLADGNHIWFETNQLPDGWHDHSVGTKPPSECRAAGWTIDPDNKDVDLLVEIYEDGNFIRSVVANIANNTLEEMCPPDGSCTFEENIFADIDEDEPNIILVRALDAQTGEWRELYGSPKELTCSTIPIAWWQATDGDAVSGSRIDSVVPAGKYLMNNSVGSSVGVPIYGSSIFPHPTSNEISSTGWNVNSNTSFLTSLYRYDKLRNMVSPNITVDLLSSPIDSPPECTPSEGNHCWYETAGDLAINFFGFDFNFEDKKEVIFVNGDLTINTDIIYNSGVGFVMFIVKENIVINPLVTNLEGIYFSTGVPNIVEANILTGTKGLVDDSPLTFNGIVSSLGGITPQRDLGDPNKTDPAEIFEFAPDLIFNFPSELIRRSLIWKEIAP